MVSKRLKIRKSMNIVKHFLCSPGKKEDYMKLIMMAAVIADAIMPATFGAMACRSR